MANEQKTAKQVAYYPDAAHLDGCQSSRKTRGGLGEEALEVKKI